MLRKLTCFGMSIALVLIVFACDQDANLPIIKVFTDLDPDAQRAATDYVRAEILPETERVVEEKGQLYSQHDIIYQDVRNKSVSILSYAKITENEVLADVVESATIDLLVQGKKRITSYVFTYRITLRKEGDTWRAIKYEPFISPDTINSPQGDPPVPPSFIKLSDIPQKTEENVSPAPILLSKPPYNPTSAVNYARQYAIKPNPAYRLFTEDCTNFISQSVKAGGWVYVYGLYILSNVWWYNDITQSYTWAGAHNFYWFTKNSGRGSSAKYFSDLKLGDVLQIDFQKDGYIDHTMIITKLSAGKIYLSYHTPNTLDELLDSIKSRNPNANFYGWNL